MKSVTPALISVIIILILSSHLLLGLLNGLFLQVLRPKYCMQDAKHGYVADHVKFLIFIIEEM
jgi:hypothetical protein